VWILTVLDHFTKYLWAEAFQTKDAEPIAEYLYRIFKDGVMMPERWHADNGGEFKNYHIDAVRVLLAANSVNPDCLLPYSHSMPRNPQCQGLVERGNRTIKQKLLKKMTADGYDIANDTVYEWIPYLERQVRALNRKDIKLYGVCPIILVTGQPPEAPDHVSLSPEELGRLHQHCAQALVRQAQGMESVACHEHFDRGDVVLVHQLAKRSHKDARGHGNKSYPARAVVVGQSTKNEHHYELMWTTYGLHAIEDVGDISKKMWPAWRLKKCKLTIDRGFFYPPGGDKSDLQDAENAMVKKVRAMGDEVHDPMMSESDSEEGPPVPDHEQIAEIASRSCTFATHAYSSYLCV
jgi:hypothetical protein